MLYFLDTDVCVLALRGRFPSFDARLRQVKPSQLRIATIVEAELWLGVAKSRAPDRNRAQVARFLAPFESVPFCRRGAREYAAIRASLERAGTPIGPNDLLLAATARAHAGTIVSRNRREFDRVPELEVEDWCD